METQEYLNKLKSEIDQLNAQIQRLEEATGHSEKLDDKAKQSARLAANNAKGVLSGVKSKYEELSLKKDLAVDEAKNGLEMARNDLKETFNSIKSLLQ